MQTFEYIIKAPQGLHARPAGLLVKCAQGCTSSVKLEVGEKSADAKRLFAVMGLGVKQGDTVRFHIEGETEQEDFNTIRTFCEESI